jgi:hypothetical protein
MRPANNVAAVRFPKLMKISEPQAARRARVEPFHCFVE